MWGGRVAVASKTQAYGYHLLALRDGGRRWRSRQRVARSLEKIMTCQHSNGAGGANSHQALSFCYDEESREGGEARRGEGEEGMSVVAVLRRASTAGERGGLTIKRSGLLSIQDSLALGNLLAEFQFRSPGSPISDLRPLVLISFHSPRLVPDPLATPRFT